MFGQLNAEQLAIQSTVRRFAQERIAPHAAEWDEQERFPREIFAPLADLGLAGMTVPEVYGGSALSRLDAVLAYEALASADLAVTVWLAVHNMVAGIIARFGTDTQKEWWLPDMTAGRMLGAFSLSEAGAGSDSAGLRATARRDGESYVLNGSKLWVTSGSVADIFVVMARTGEKPGASGISAFVVEAGIPGLTIGKVERKMGLHASPTTELLFTDCHIPVDHRLGKDGEGLRIALSALDGGRVNIAAGAVGVAQTAFAIATEYACRREQFGQTIIQFQMVQALLADMAIGIESSRLMVYRAADVLDARGEATKEAAMAKCLATDTAMQVTTNAIQVLGGIGYTRDLPIERMMRDIKVTQIFEGTNQIQRLVIARALIREQKKSLAS